MKKSYKDYYFRDRYYIMILVFLFPIAYIIKLIPRKKGLYLYGSMNGFKIADNSKYKFINEYTVNSYFITKNIEIKEEFIFDKIKPVLSSSFFGIYLQLRAEKIYYTNGIFDFSPLLIFGSEIVALWHGAPVKKIGPEVNYIDNSRFKVKVWNFIYKFFPYTYYMYCNKVICPFLELKSDYEHYFVIGKPIIEINKQPRNKYVKKLKIEKNKILYAPTYRNYRSLHDVCKSLDFFNKEVHEIIEKKNLKIILRPHPIDREILDTSLLPNFLEIDTSDDLYDSLTSYDCVITDYSSIYYDCKELHKNVYLLADDIDLYDKENGLSEVYINKMKNEYFKSAIDLFKFI